MNGGGDAPVSDLEDRADRNDELPSPEGDAVRALVEDDGVGRDLSSGRKKPAVAQNQDSRTRQRLTTLVGWLAPDAGQVQ